MISSGFRDSWKYNESLSATSKHPKDSRYIAMCLIVNVLQIITAAVFTVSCELPTSGSYRNGSKSQEMLPLWKWEKGGKFPVRPVDVVASDTPYRNGSESGEMLPLWKWEKGGKCPVRPVDVVASDAPCRNGSKSGEMLPLWVGRRGRQAPRAVGRGRSRWCRTVRSTGR